jgi:prepilin peptidase CpaA
MENIALVLFPALMVFAAFSDLLTLTIPNVISLVLILLYFALSAWIGTPLFVITLHVCCGLVVLARSFVLFEMGIIGGGDAKLASATALWLGFENLMDYAVAFSFIGGGLAMAIISLRWHTHADQGQSVSLLGRLADKAVNRMPYGVALGIAGMLLYPHSTIWHGLAGV